MATSGSTNYALTAREIIEYAVQKINLVADGNSVPAEMAARAQRELNVMLKEWMKYPAIWRTTEISVTPVANTAAISLSAANPYRVIDARFRNTSGIDLPMEEMTRQEYDHMPLKLATGVPTQWLFDARQATSNLIIWPVLAAVTTETIPLTIQRRIEDIDDPSNDLDITQEHLSTVGHNLAARLADDYGRRGPHIDRVLQRAQMLFEDMLDADRPEVIRFIPDSRYA